MPNTKSQNDNRRETDQQQQRSPGSQRVEGQAGSARDREMGRADAPLGDLGHGRESWKPPAGEQGISNRPDDDGTETAKNASPLNAEEQQQDGDIDPEMEVFDQKAGDRSNRAAHSGATGERGTEGRRNKPEPKNQDEKGMGHLRNR